MKVNHMVKDNIFIVIKTGILVNFKRSKNMEMEYIIIQMVQNMKDIY